MMTSVTVVMLNINGVCFPNDMSFGRQNSGESIPFIGVEGAVFKMLYFVV
jgi:hypothetical protein